MTTTHNGLTTNQIHKTFMREFLQNSVKQVCGMHVLSGIENRTYLSVTANVKSVALWLVTVL